MELRILSIILPGFFVGVLIMNSFRKIFSEDATIVRKLFEDQPVTMFAAATTIGSVIVWAVQRILGI